MSQEQRLQFLVRLHELSGGDESKYVDSDEVATDIGLDKTELRTVTQYLEGEGLLAVQIKNKGMPMFITITHNGIKAVESGKI